MTDAEILQDPFGKISAFRGTDPHAEASFGQLTESFRNSGVKTVFQVSEFGVAFSISGNQGGNTLRIFGTDDVGEYVIEGRPYIPADPFM
jgi:hypothetical protein